MGRRQMPIGESQFSPSVRPWSSDMAASLDPRNHLSSSVGHTASWARRGAHLSAVHLSRELKWSSLSCPAPSVGLAVWSDPGAGSWSREDFGSYELGTPRGGPPFLFLLHGVGDGVGVRLALPAASASFGSPSSFLRPVSRHPSRSYEDLGTLVEGSQAASAAPGVSAGLVKRVGGFGAQNSQQEPLKDAAGAS